jgi:hypothetical protein
MNQNKADRRRQRALERLVGRLGDNLATGRRPSFAQRLEYNSLKQKLGQEGRII